MLSQNVELAKLRAKVLEQAGCSVRVPLNREQAQDEIAADPPDVLLIAYTLSHHSAVFFSTMFRQKNPAGRVVAINATPFEPRPQYADAHLSAVDDPDAMIEAVCGKDATGAR